MTISTPQAPRLGKGAAIAACGALLILFAIISYTAVLSKSATYDEPLHAVAGFVHRTTGDFRIDAEDPALFGYWSALPHSREALKLNFESPFWDRMLTDSSTNQWYFVVNSLYRTPGVDVDAFVNESRFMFVLVGVGLGMLIAVWSWQLGGMAAAIIATALFALDPNFLAHSALVKNDVMLSLTMAGLALALWRFGRKGTWLSLAAIALICAAAVNVKFSGLLCGPIVFALLVIRALMPDEWRVLGITLANRWRRVMVAPAVCGLVAVVCVGGIWACYGFRFTPTSDPKVLLNTPYVVFRAKQSKLRAQGLPQVTREMIDHEPLGPVVDGALWAEAKHLLPQSWLYGFLFTRATTYIRASFLMGETKETGWWYYFPCTMLFKTPTATLAAMPIALVCALSRKRQAMHIVGRFDWWSVICLALPPIAYGAAAMAANLNLGLRHILPVYPYIFIGLSLGFSRLIARGSSFGKIVPMVIVIGLACESLAAYPNYLAFFNTPSAGVGKINLLGDSNLDWGQDLKNLAAWRAEHRDQPMYLAYFGIADPHYYQIDEIDVPSEAGGWPFALNDQLPHPPCYMATSATALQGIYLSNPAAAEFYQDLLRHHQPLAVLNDTIYIYQIGQPR